MLVSIGLPVRNGARFIGRALATLTAQTYSPLQIIISDNASLDETERICLEMKSTDSRIEFLRLQTEVGIAENFNKVLELARGRYFMWAAHDDIWEATFVSRLVERLASDPDNVLAFCAMDNIDGQGKSVRSYPRLKDLIAESKVEQLARYISQDERSGKANLIYGLTKREALLAAGGFRFWGRGAWGSDMLIVFRLLTEGKLVFSDDLLFHKRLLPERIDGLRALNLAKELALKRGYFAGYDRIILESTNQLTSEQRTSLLELVADRRTELRRSLFKRLKGATFGRGENPPRRI